MTVPPVVNAADLSIVEQASRLLFSIHAGSRDGRPTSKIRLIKLVPFLFAAVLLAATFTGCETIDVDAGPIAAMNAAIPNEPQGDYFVGRRMYKQDYKMWGWVREPGKPWKSAKLVMMNEQIKLAPDREAGKLGSDNNYEYRLTGSFSGNNTELSINFIPKMNINKLMDGYRSIVNTIYAPNQYYARVKIGRAHV